MQRKQKGKAPPKRAQKSKQTTYRTMPVRATPRGTSFADSGEAIGSTFGPIGGILGRAGGSILGSIFGRGEYKVNSNTLMTQNQTPVFSSNSAGSVTIAHREFLTDVASIGAVFNNTSYPINPGLTRTFPFLSQIAKNFEQYEMLGCIFHFKSTSATAVSSTNTALGTVVLATDYETLDAPFANKQQMEAYQYCSSSVPCASVIHPIECAPRQTVLSRQFIRTTSVPTGGDPRIYDVGNFQIATTGQQAAAVIGELWVSYHVRLFKPKIENPIGNSLLCYAGSASVTSGVDTLVGLVPLGTANRMAITLSAANQISLPFVGRYLISLFTSSPVGSTNYSTSVFVTDANCANVTSHGTSLVANRENNFTASIDVLNPGALLTFPLYTHTGAGTTLSSLSITQVPSNFSWP